MKAMILAAGRGERLRPLTDTLPKPLIQIGKHRLIEYHLTRLAKNGFQEVIINLSHLGSVIEETIGDGHRYGLNIRYSQEGEERMNTGGGIANALPLLGDDPFLVVNADIYCEYEYRSIELPQNADMHLIMVDNPKHNADGDFTYLDNKLINTSSTRLTFSGIGYYRPALFHERNGKFPLADLIHEVITKDRCSAEHYIGYWSDVGTIERLNETKAYLDDLE